MQSVETDYYLSMILVSRLIEISLSTLCDTVSLRLTDWCDAVGSGVRRDGPSAASSAIFRATTNPALPLPRLIG